MHSRRVLPTLILASLLGATILAVQPAGGLPVSAEQEALVDGTFQDSLAPYNPWQTKIGNTVFYMHSAPTSTATPDGGSVPFSLGLPPGAALDAVRPLAELNAFPVLGGAPRTQADAIASPDPNDKTALIYGPGFAFPDLLGGYTPDPTGTTQPTMTFPMAGTPEDVVKAYNVEMRIYAACDTGSFNLPNQGPITTTETQFHIRAILYQQTLADGEWTNTATLKSLALLPQAGPAGAPGLIQEFRNSGAVNSVLSDNTGSDPTPSNPNIGDGPRFEPGKHRLALELRMPEILSQNAYGAGCYIHYDSTAFPSRFILRDDATRLAAFTQNVDGEQVSGFPRGTQADAASRRVTVQALQANAWPGGADQVLEENVKIRVLDLTDSTYAYYVDNINEEDDLDIDFREIDLISTDEKALSPTLVQRTYVLSYPQSYTGGTYQIELYNKGTPHKPAQWEAQVTQFTVGLRGLTLTRADGEIASHSINPGEPTEFAFLLRNVGNEDDQVTIGVNDPGAGWTAEIEGGGLFFLRPGGKAIGHVTLTPPATAVAGASRSITLTAGSSFTDVTDPPALTYTATVVADRVPGLDVSSTMSQLTIRPGETKTIDVAVANRGTARDSFVLIPSFPGNVQGWTVTASPASVQVLAGAVENVQVRVRAPADAASGMTFPLGLSVQQVGDATLNDRVDISVVVFALEGLLVDVFDDVNRTLREDFEVCRGGAAGSAIAQDGEGFLLNLLIGSEQCDFSGQPVDTPAGQQGAPLNEEIFDEDSDNSAIFRLEVNNLGDLPEQYKVTGVWSTETEGTQDNDACELDGSGGAAGDGIPDTWRFNWGEDVGQPLPSGQQAGAGQFSGGYSGVYTLSDSETQPFSVAPRSTRYAYLELGWVPTGNFSCGTNQYGTDGKPDSTTSAVATFAITFESLDDPTRQITREVTARLAPAGVFQAKDDFSGGTHLPAVELGPDQAPTLPANVARPAVFNVTVVNKANEHDDLVIDVSDPPAGWRHDVVVTGSAPGGIVCPVPDNGGSFVCQGMGVFDEVHLQIVATPNANVRIGERNHITIVAASGDEPGITRSLQVTARAAGTYDFAVQALGLTTRSVQPGQTVSFPLVIANDGTEGDTYGVTLIGGDVNEWRAVVSTSSGLFVPAGSEVPAFVTVTAPSTAPAGTTDVFRVQVESAGNGAKKTVEFSPRVIASSPLTVFGKDGQDVLIPVRGVDTMVNITSVQVSGVAQSPVVFTVDKASLPTGWEVDRLTATVPANPDSSGRPTATATFKVRAPAEAIGTSRAIFHVTAEAGTLEGFTDVNLNLASTYGLNLTVEEPQLVIAPGGFALFNLTLRNLGLGQDVVAFSNSALPTGWTRTFNPPSLTLGPLETQEVQLKLGAPATANPGDIASILAFASSRSDTTQFSSVALGAVVGFNAMTVEALDDTVPKASPQETVVQVFNVTNTGTLPDEIRVQAVLDTVGQAANVKYSGGPETFKLNPGESAQVTLNTALGPNIPSGILVQTTLRYTSLLDERPAATRAGANVTVQAQVLDYQFADVNGDGLRDYAVDRNDDAADGFEQFQASTTPGGRPLASADLARFLRDDVREGLSQDITLVDGTTARIVVIPLDGDGDGLRDHLLDGDADGQPDYYWDPDANKAAPIDFRKDVNGDQVPESFVDVDGDGRIDAVYDLTRAEFTDVVQIDVDGDGVLDYVVDRDGDGNVDQDETVLYTRSGALLIVQKVDVDGDDRLDQVFDTNGDGNPDYFIPDGSTGSVPLVLRDVNGDGTQDWTFDGDNDGRRESYYDPVTGEAHVIDAAGHFMDAMREYWYIGAMFVVVLVLFVALVLVTRK